METEKSKIVRILIIITSITAAVMELIDISIVNVALTNISGTLGATVEDASWVVTAYGIANVIIIPLTGFLSRYFGRKNYYLTSILLFTLASYMCGNSSSLWMLVFWRFVQGIGGGALLSVSQGILFDQFKPEQKGIAGGIFGMGIVIGPTIGPVLGGYIVDNYHWGLIFDINIPVGILAAILTWYFVEKKPDEFKIDRKSLSIDYIGIISLCVGIGALQYVLEKGQSEDWFEDEMIRYLTAAAILGLTVFIWWELRTKSPVINLKVMKSRNLTGSNILTFVCGFGLFGSAYLFPVMVQRAMGYTPTDAGLAMIPGALVSLLAMPLIGIGLGKGIKPVYFVTMGFAFFVLHGYTCSQVAPGADKWWFIVSQLCRGLGSGCLTVPLLTQAVVGLKPQDMPYGISLNNMCRQLGGAFGIAIMNTYATNRSATHRMDLVSNLQENNPLMIERLHQYAAGFMAKGIAPLNAQNLAVGSLERSIAGQAQMLAYLDGFLLISAFFICSIPFMLLLKNQNMDAETRAKVATAAH
ncbi:MFS transporter, DHA2 family, multidrug resistance protein [Flavobacterium aquidurense]|uniref:MFS transporter n=1 Tax=Flavobacterium frigidimaris TaxID=262320 RepID=A0ABX4BM96_FLAFR|nr:DHA2 family efflux MFS transporter permease subunit [Flavobacterium frigidimaris]OXA77416.1 MFS transporter [Flavobacterium frigidimaris]SDZ62573.1 MFS transporter, DHA2 family, multidrug resistance protein [Flavobacterium aquidurense]